MKAKTKRLIFELEAHIMEVDDKHGKLLVELSERLDNLTRIVNSKTDWTVVNPTMIHPEDKPIATLKEVIKSENKLISNAVVFSAKKPVMK